MKNRLATIIPALAIALALTPVIGAAGSPAAQAGQTQISGQVNSKCGESIPGGLQAQLVDAKGVAVPGMTTPVAPDGKFVFDKVPAGIFTVRIVNPADSGVQGTSSVVAGVGRVVNAVVTIGAAECGFFTKKKTLVVLGAAAVGGAVAIIATGKEASPSR